MRTARTAASGCARRRSFRARSMRAAAIACPRRRALPSDCRGGCSRRLGRLRGATAGISRYRRACDAPRPTSSTSRPCRAQRASSSRWRSRRSTSRVSGGAAPPRRCTACA
eukprot:2391037-Prymnesium_polylepis.1